ncbi:translation initiation factor eIF-3 subunit 7 [Pseudogymnoascus sp. 24MN13]|nr:translation initiation factor eIF-3 subunit 7 [Pseudogymnoascus sp. 24MN13]
MAPISLAEIVSALPSADGWGPATSTETTLDGVPYAPYSKGDKLGRMADWTSEGKDGRDGRGGRQQYNRNYRDQQVYGAGTSSLFAVQLAEDESSFSVVSNTRDTAKTRFGRGGGLARGGEHRGGAAGTPEAAEASSRESATDAEEHRVDTVATMHVEAEVRNRDASVNIKPDWKLLEEIDFNRLTKLNLDADEGEDVDSYGFVYRYDRSFDKPATKSNERTPSGVDRASHNVTTSSDPVIQDLAERDEATIFATDSVLSMLMCAPRSVYPWDIVIVRQGNKIFLDKRDNAALDMVSPAALAEEATYINHNFANQTMIEDDAHRSDMANENPFYNAAEETDPPASKAYKYLGFDLAVTEECAAQPDCPGEDQYVTVKALNEFDHKAQGSGGALDWRTKLVSARGAVVATEMKNNSCKLARWTVQSIIANADVMKLGFVSRANPKSNDRHMNLSLSNGWGIVRTIVDMCMAQPEGKYVLVKDPNKQILRLYDVPSSSFEEEVEEEAEVAEEDEEE